MNPIPLQGVAGKIRMKDRAKRLLGPSMYRGLRRTALQVIRIGTKTRRNVRQASYLVGANRSGKFERSGYLFWNETDQASPEAAFAENFTQVGTVLDLYKIDWWVVSSDGTRRFVVGVDIKDRGSVLSAFSQSATETLLYAMNADGPNPHVPGDKIQGAPSIPSATVLRIAMPRRLQGTDLKFGMNYGCDIEFWTVGDAGAMAPRENRAARLLAKDDFTMVPDETIGRETQTPVALTRRMLDDITFPIDAVYTWVDGGDPEWMESKERLEAEMAGVAYHPEANHAARFRSRDELRYSLRSLAMYAPWFRRIFIVTSGQVPEWLDLDHPKIVLVEHADIYDTAEHLPTFNSNSIISRLHHIPDLSEHYVYINDDVFFGRLVRPEQFFYPSGIAKVSPSRNRRPFGDPAVTDEPHINLTRNMRRLLEEEFGVTISRAIKHTPHPQLKSVHFQLESTFPEAYENTWASHFRHHTDIVADQLHHYFAQIVGRAVPGNLLYNYINVLDDSYRGVMARTLRSRNRDTFCINDAPVEGAQPMTDDEVVQFLEDYFPLKSCFEK